MILGIPKAELLAMLKEGDLTPELIAEVIDRNNQKMSELFTGTEFKSYVVDSIVERVLNEIRS